MNRRKTFATSIILLSSCFVACVTRNKPRPLNQVQQAAKDNLESLQKMADETEQTYRHMDISSLLTNLSEDSARQIEPFNSLAYLELTRRKDIPAESLISLVNQKKNGDSLLPLLLLRELNEQAYRTIPAEERATILAAALEDSKMFNTWGIPGVYLEDASEAMLETGKNAYPALKKMLTETRAAPLFGGQQNMLYERYQYRLCDYALFFLERIRRPKDFQLPESASDRDTLIKELLK